MGKITRETKISELVLEYPSSAGVLLNHGFHCIGCGLSAYESVEEGARVHGYDDAEIDLIVKELNDAADEDLRIKARLEKEIAQKPGEASQKESLGKNLPDKKKAGKK
jgi:hybrid cluster-associated redox disulfide protein